MCKTKKSYKFNPFAQEKRDFFFFSDPPHLVKTQKLLVVKEAQPLGQNVAIRLWCIDVLFHILQYNGKTISWSNLTKLYNRDTEPGMGIRMLPKLKFEHISLTSFSKMRVDLAAQVRTAPSEPMYKKKQTSLLQIFCNIGSE